MLTCVYFAPGAVNVESGEGAAVVKGPGLVSWIMGEVFSLPALILVGEREGERKREWEALHVEQHRLPAHPSSGASSTTDDFRLLRYFPRLLSTSGFCQSDKYCWKASVATVLICAKFSSPVETSGSSTSHYRGV